MSHERLPQGGKAEGKEGKAKLAAAHATLEKAEARIAELQVSLKALGTFSACDFKPEIFAGCSSEVPSYIHSWNLFAAVLTSGYAVYW